MSAWLLHNMLRTCLALRSCVRQQLCAVVVNHVSFCKLKCCLPIESLLFLHMVSFLSLAVFESRPFAPACLPACPHLNPAEKLRKLADDGFKRFEGFEYDVEADIETYRQMAATVAPFISDTVFQINEWCVGGVLGCEPRVVHLPGGGSSL